MLDDFDSIQTLDSTAFLNQLVTLPHSYEGPDGIRKEPYGLMAYGEASIVPDLLASWFDAPVVVSGTQFLFAGGFDYGEVAPMKLNAELGGAEVIVLGHDVHEPNFEVKPSVLSTFTYAGYLAHATGHKEDWGEANEQMNTLLQMVKPDIETNQNPAKTLAWNLWNRVPLIVSGRQQAGLSKVVQRVLARVGKSLALTTHEHPLEVLTGAFEGRHQLGDDVVGLIVGDEDGEVALSKEVMESRIAQIESLQLPFAGVAKAPEDTGAYNIVVWYLSLWVAAYLALLNKLDPADSPVYETARNAVPQSS